MLAREAHQFLGGDVMALAQRDIRQHQFAPILVWLSDDARLQPLYNTATMETNVPNLFLAGVVCGGMNTHIWFIENSRIHAKIIVDRIIGNT